jgi:RHS repeat-associated protein
MNLNAFKIKKIQARLLGLLAVFLWLGTSSGFAQCIKSKEFRSSAGSAERKAFKEYLATTPKTKYYKLELYALAGEVALGGHTYVLEYNGIRSCTNTYPLSWYASSYYASTDGVGSADGDNDGWEADYWSAEWDAAETAWDVCWTGQNTSNISEVRNPTTLYYSHHYTADDDVQEYYTLLELYPWSEVKALAVAAMSETGYARKAFTTATALSDGMKVEVQGFSMTVYVDLPKDGKQYKLRYKNSNGDVKDQEIDKDGKVVVTVAPPELDEADYSAVVSIDETSLEVISDGAGGGGSGGGSGGCKSCGDGGVTSVTPIGTARTFLNSVDLRFELGGGLGYENVGQLLVYSKVPSASLSTPTNLVFSGWPGLVTITTNGSGSISSIAAPLGYVQVYSTNTHKYELRFYGFDGTNYLTNTAPFVTWRIEDPDAGTNSYKKLRVTELRGASSITNLYEWDSGLAEWTLNRANLSKEIKFRTDEVAGVQWTYHRWVLDPISSEVLAKSSVTYRSNSWGDSIIQEATGETNGLNVVTHTYDSNGFRTGSDYSSGDWERVQYNSSNWVSKVFRPFQNATATTTESACRTTEYSYSPITGAGDDGSIKPWVARRTIEKVLGTEVSRSYTVITTNETRTIVCTIPGADWDSTNNLVTVVRQYDEGDFEGWTQSETRPDGTKSFYEYEWDVNNNLTTTTYSGAPGVTGTNVVDGVKTVRITGAAGETISVTQIDILSNITIAQEVYSGFDNLRRPGRVTYLNGDVKTFVYACCNIESETDENGITTSYTYDTLKRRTSATRAGVSMINLYDAANHVVATIKQGTNSTQMLMSSNIYNTASDRVLSMDAVGNETTYAQTVSSGVKTLTTTLPDGATDVRMYYRDGSQKSVGGTANHGLKYEYGVETEGGVARTYTKQTKLLTNGSDSSEWVKSYTDAVGNSYKTVYPDEAAEVAYFNSKGQAWKQVDADGVVRLSQYNAKGQREYSVLDVNRDDTIDFDGTDRITRSLSYATNAHGVDVVRSETWQWQTLGANTPVMLSTLDRSVETKESWQFAFGLTNYSIHVCVTNLVICYSTNRAPDGSYTVSMSQYGLPLSSTRYASNGVQLAQQSMGYDAFNRTITMTDARTGTITNTLDALGRTLTRTTPAPAPGLNPQTTQTDYDVRGQLWRTIQPDGGVVVNTYYDTGELKKTYGNRTYPVEYTYDYAGRMKTLKTWQDFANDSGAAVTIWNYDSQRGFMTSKRYADNKGPDYEYNLTGKLAKRTWARGVETDYTYNDAGDLETVDYSDSTPDVTYTYDRMGRKASVAQGTQDAVTLHYTAAGQLAAEQHTSGLLSGITVTNAYDGLLRRTGLTVLTNGGSVYQALYGYDAASRMLTVSDGTNNATYSYVTNSSLVAEIAFKQNSTLRMTTIKQYDLLNRLTNISSTTASFTNWFVYLYNDANQRTKLTREDGSSWNYGYDDLGQVTSGKRYWGDNSPVTGEQFDYEFDDIGNRKSITQNSKHETRNSLYTGNLLNQYTSRSVPGYVDLLGTSHSNATVTVNFERVARKGEYWHKELSLSNMVSAVYAGITNIAVLDDGASPDIVATNKGNLFLPKTPEQFTYDDDGNPMGDGRWTYTWDGENRLIQMETKTGAVSAGTPKQKLEFAYDDRWRRIQKKVSDWNGSSYTGSYTNRFVYDGRNLLAILDAKNLKQSFLWGKDLFGSLQRAGGIEGLISVKDNATGISQVVSYDGNGNVKVLINSANGEVVGSYEYGPFGEPIRISGIYAESNPFRYSTKYMDKENGLTYFGYRYYSAILGRWANKDPLNEAGGANTYSACRNAPIKYIDPFGLSVDVILGPFPGFDPIEGKMDSAESALDAISKAWVAQGKDRIYFQVASTKHANKKLCGLNDCIKELQIQGHGGSLETWAHQSVGSTHSTYDLYNSTLPPEQIKKVGEDNIDYNGLSFDEVEGVYRYGGLGMFDNVKFCKECDIYLRGCSIARFSGGVQLMKQIASITKCRVHAFKVDASPNPKYGGLDGPNFDGESFWMKYFVNPELIVDENGVYDPIGLPNKDEYRHLN